MGIFDWFRRRPALRIVCWLDETSRWSGLVVKIADDLAQGRNVLLLGHFKDSLVRAGQQLAERGISFETRTKWSNADIDDLTAAGPARVAASLAGSLPHVPAGAPKPAVTGSPVAVHLCDLHVLEGENQRVLRFAASLPASVQVSASVSFDDPLMAEFASPWVKSMMQTMGLKEGESIDSPMVAKGLQRALRKLEKRVTGDVPCDSVAEWMERNLGK
jgi:hypothetical protein